MSEDALPQVKATYTGKIREYIDLIPSEILEKSEEQLKALANPTLRLYQCKIKFHKETLAAQADGRAVVQSNITSGIISPANFYKDVLRNPVKLAWILSPLIVYEDATKAALLKAVNRYDELISMEITVTKRKKVDDEWVEYKETCPKKVMALMFVIKNLEDRIKGTAIQRQITVGASQPKERDATAVLNMEAIESKLKELEGRLGGSDADKDVRGITNSVDEGKNQGDTKPGQDVAMRGANKAAQLVVDVESRVIK